MWSSKDEESSIAERQELLELIDANASIRHRLAAIEINALTHVVFNQFEFLFCVVWTWRGVLSMIVLPPTDLEREYVKNSSVVK
jgi:hypothetical protein